MLMQHVLVDVNVRNIQYLGYPCIGIKWLQCNANSPIFFKIYPSEMSKVGILKEFWTFLKVRKKLWLAPIVFILLLLGLLIVVTSNTALAPFIYALF